MGLVVNNFFRTMGFLSFVGKMGRDKIILIDAVNDNGCANARERNTTAFDLVVDGLLFDTEVFR